jgi:cytochrome c peroxidase
MNIKRRLSATSLLVVMLTLLLGSIASHAQRDGRGDGGRREPRGPRLSFPLSTLPLEVAAPANNTQSPAKIDLGRLLFWDPVISGNQEVACATCHHPEYGYAEDLDISIGVDGAGLGHRRQFVTADPIPFVKRNSQTLLNTAFNGIDPSGNYDPASAPMFWDLRAESLEAQALIPLITFEEMRGRAYSEEDALDSVVARLREIPEYRAMFADAFGGAQPVTAENLGRALAAFQRTLIANDSPYDRYMRGDKSAMTAIQVRGMQAFQDIGCISCHNGPMFSDYKPHVLGVRGNRKLVVPDEGIEATHAFRTPSLRNLAYTAPYMHNGRFDDLDDVLEFYDRRGGGGRRGGNRDGLTRDQLDPLLRGLGDPDDFETELLEFLDALNDDSFDRTVPATVPSGLNPGGRI